MACALHVIMDTKHSSVIIDGMRLHWAECGDATDGVPLVLLHGLNDSHMTWRRVAPLMAARRRVLMPDAPGCGLSERPDASYQLAWHAHVIARWLEMLGLSEVDVVGHSFGGGVAQMMLLDPTVTIRRLGLIAAGGLGPRIAFWLRLAAVPGVVEYLGQPFMAAGTRLALRAAGDCISMQDVAELSAMNGQAGSARAFARTLQDVISWRGQSQHFFPRAYEIAHLPPITLFWGDSDVIIPLADAEAFARKVDGVSVECFAGCGHYLHHEQPEAFALKLLEFLDIAQARPTHLPVRAQEPLSALERNWVALLGRLTQLYKVPIEGSAHAGPALPALIESELAGLTAQRAEADRSVGQDCALPDGRVAAELVDSAIAP
jgi:pimeloyl-ACP methyl ester carboxylesterase